MDMVRPSAVNSSLEQLKSIEKEKIYFQELSHA